MIEYGEQYQRIGHLPGSRMAPDDIPVSPDRARVATERLRDSHDKVIVQEKLDGSCMVVLRDGGGLVPLTRSGRLAVAAHHEHQRLFVDWVFANSSRFMAVLRNGERLVGEWLALAHGTRYTLTREPFAPFDLMSGAVREPHHIFLRRLGGRFDLPKLIWAEHKPLPLAKMLKRLGPSGHGSTDPVEGVVYRVERNGSVEFLAKWVRKDKEDGKYLPGPGRLPIWQWRPK